VSATQLNPSLPMIRHYGRGDVGFGRTADGLHLMYMRNGSVSLHPDSWLVGMLDHIAKLEADLAAATAKRSGPEIESDASLRDRLLRMSRAHWLSKDADDVRIASGAALDEIAARHGVLRRVKWPQL